jgi:hypothetical protein
VDILAKIASAMGHRIDIVKDDRFDLQKLHKSGYWVCTDTVNGVVCTFENHNFNENQKFSLIEGSAIDAAHIAEVMTEMGDWLRANHYGKVF